MNVELLEKVKARILAEPEKFDMSWWFTPTECGTAACIAGWTAVVAGWRRYKETDSFCYKERVSGKHVSEIAREELDLNHAECHRLFNVANWPVQFISTGYGDARYSDVDKAAARIDHFIATGGAE